MADTNAKKKSSVRVLTAIIGVIFVAVLVMLTLLLVKVQKNGFVFENDKVYYYNNGELQVGVAKIDNNTYYFRENGEMHTGWLRWGDDLFFYSKGDGKDDFGGALLVNEKMAVTDADGYYWVVEFGDNGRVVNYIIDEDRCKANGKDFSNVTVPNFGV